MELRDADVLCILRTLEFDGLVESSLSDDGEVYRPARHVVPKTSPFTSMPCGVCPVRPVFTLQIPCLSLSRLQLLIVFHLVPDDGSLCWSVGYQ